MRRDVAKCSVKAAWMLHGLRFGKKPGHETLCFFCVKWLQPSMKGTSSVWQAPLRSIRYVIGSLIVLQRVVGALRVVICSGSIPACRSQWNGCMNVAMLYCHVRREMRVCDMMLRMDVGRASF